MKENRTSERRARRHRDKKTTNASRKVRRKTKRTSIFNKRFVGFLVFIAFFVTFITCMRHPYFKISQVYVDGNDRIQDTDILSKIENPIGKNILLYNSKKQEKRLLDNDMIESAKLEKKFPKILKIKVSEIYPQFLIENGNKNIYVSNKQTIISSQNSSESLENSLIKIRVNSYNDKVKEAFTDDKEIIEFINRVKDTSYVDLISELNFENKSHIGIIVKDIRVDFGSLKESSYKLGLLDSILKDIESKGQDVSSINLTNGKKPIVKMNEGS